MKNPLFRAWPIIPVAIILIIPTFGECFHSEHVIAFEGAIYQIFGIGIVVFGLDDKLKYFRGISILGSLLKWCKDMLTWIGTIWPWRKPKNVNIQGNVIGMSSAFGRATVIQQIDRLSTQDQLNWLKKKVDELAGIIDSNNDKVLNQIKNLDNKINGVDSSVSLKISDFNNKLGSFMTGSFKLEILGAVFLIIGVIFGTIPWWVCSLYERW